MKVFFVACLLVAEIFSVYANQNFNASDPEFRELIDINLNNQDVSSNENTYEPQRKRDPGYYYAKPNRYYYSSHRDCPHPGYPGRIINRQPNRINRPFKQYGPPNQESTRYNYEMPAETLVNQDMPSHTRDTDFVEESPIASQNNQPFGQHTANYLPPQNQKLPASNAPHLFSNKYRDFMSGNEQFQNQQQIQQFQFDNQNSLGNNFNTATPNFVQNDFRNQQISDAAAFLSQNAQAISNLYAAPASNENYAPHNQEFPDVHQNNQPIQNNFQNQHLQGSIAQPSSELQGPLPSSDSGVLNTQDTLEKIQSLEKDRIIAQLQQALTNRESTARHAQNFNEYLQNENLQYQSSASTLQLQTTSKPSISQQTIFSPTSATSSSVYQGFYAPSGFDTNPAIPPISSPTTTTTTTHLLNHGSGGSGNAQTEIKLSVPVNLRPSTTESSGFPQYNGFVPSFVSTGFVPSSPTYATTLIPASPLKPADNAPTHFGIPIPTLQGLSPPTQQVPSHQPPNSTPTTAGPSDISSSNPNRPTLSISLGSVATALQPPVVGSKPVSVIPSTTPVHPIYGIHPTVVNPNFLYKPVKVLPIYYYPNVAYQSVHKPVASTAIQPWSYAPSFAQTKQSHIWK